MNMEDDKLASELAIKLWNISVKHSDHKKYQDFKDILNTINSKDEEFAVTCILKISSLIDAYTWQNTNKPYL